MLEGTSRGFPQYTLQTEIAEWAQTVADRGATVSTTRRNMNDSLVVSLKTAGLWSKLDRLYVLAAENTTQGLMDLTRRANMFNQTATFQVDRGFTGTGGGISDQISTDFFPGQAVSPNYTTDSACYFGWNNTTGVTVNQFMGLSNVRTNIFIQDGSGNCSWSINFAISTWNVFAHTAVQGLYLANRTGSTSSTLDVNGVQVATAANASVAPTTQQFGCLQDSGKQMCLFGCGAGLSTTERVVIYSIFRSYLSNLGVP